MYRWSSNEPVPEGNIAMRGNVVVWITCYLAILAIAASPRAASGTDQTPDVKVVPTQRDVQLIAVPEKDYRQLKAEDGLDATMSIVEAWFSDGGTKMEGEIDSITFTNPSGQKLQIELASRSVSGGQIRTVDFGIMFMKPGSNFTAELFLTNDQIRQIKNKMEAAVSDK